MFFIKYRGGGEPTMTKDEVVAKYNNSGIIIVTENSINYQLIPMHIRQKNNFVVDINNVCDYTQI